MLYRFTSYFAFLLQSTNQHGVHSPFVFHLVTRCLYNKTTYPEYAFITPHRLTLKQHQLLFRLSRYFNVKSVLLFNTLANKELSNTLYLAQPNAIIRNNITNTNAADLIVVTQTNLFPIKQLDPILKACHNDTLIVFNNIYESKNTYAVWKAIQEHPKVRVTLNTYRFGFVFVRHEQVKQHFSIRV